jgi:hypothetical protein
MNNFLSNYKTTIPAIVMLAGMVVAFVFLATKIIDTGGFAVVATSLISVCTFLIGIGSKDADK